MVAGRVDMTDRVERPPGLPAERFDASPGHRHLAAAPEDGAAGGDVALSLPAPLRAAIERRRERWTPVDTCAAGLIALHLVVLLILVVPGSLFVDDLRAQGYAQGQPFWSFIVGSNGTHFAPIPRAVDWVQSRLFPLEHPPAVVLTLLIRLALAIAFWRLLRRMFGARPAVLVPLGLLLLSPVLIPATTWYRQCLTAVLAAVTMVWAVDAQLRWVLDRRRRDLVALLAATGIGLCSYEKAALIPLLVAGSGVLVFARPRRARAVAWLRPTLVATALSGLMVAGFLVIYLLGPYDRGSPHPPGPLTLLHLTWSTLLRGVLPLVYGGPWHWAYLGPYAGTPMLSAGAERTVLAVTLLIAGYAVLRDRGRALRGLLLLAGWAVPSVAIVAVGRYDALGFYLADSTRFWADLAPAVLLAGAMALLPWRVGAAAPGPGASGHLARTRLGGTPPAGRVVEVRPRDLTAGAILLVLLLGSGVSTWTFADAWWDNPTGDYLARFRSSLRTAEPYPRILATPLPPTVLPAWVSLAFPTSAPLVRLIRPDARFEDGDGTARAFGSNGQLGPYLVQTLGRSATPRNPVTQPCIALIPPGGTRWIRVPLLEPAAWAPGSQVDVGLLNGVTTRVDVLVETPDRQLVPVPRYSDGTLPRGAHTVRHPAPPGRFVAAVRIRTENHAAACITAVHVWAPVTS